MVNEERQDGRYSLYVRTLKSGDVVVVDGKIAVQFDIDPHHPESRMLVRIVAPRPMVVEPVGRVPRIDRSWFERPETSDAQ